VLGWLHLLNPYLILVCVFFGVGFAFNAPAWTSIVPQVVSDAELPSAATLSGLNISGIIGPALGGLLVPLAGAKLVFAINAAYLVVVRAIQQWKQPAVLAKLPSESFFNSFSTVIGYIRSAPGFQVVLTRNCLFALFISAIPALMPILGLKVLNLSSSNLGLLFTSLGAGSVAGVAFVVPWLRTRFSPDSIMLSANLLIVLAYALMVLARQTEAILLSRRLPVWDGRCRLPSYGWLRSAPCPIGREAG